LLRLSRLTPVRSRQGRKATPEQIVRKLRKLERLIVEEKVVGEVAVGTCREPVD
jgi:hypothetical protein